jgi:hypothetical protein
MNVRCESREKQDEREVVYEIQQDVPENPRNLGAI